MRINRIIAELYLALQTSPNNISREIMDFQDRAVDESERVGQWLGDKAFVRGLHQAIRRGLAQEEARPSPEWTALTYQLRAVTDLSVLHEVYGYDIPRLKQEEPPEFRTQAEKTRHSIQHGRVMLRPIEYEWKRRQREMSQ